MRDLHGKQMFSTYSMRYDGQRTYAKTVHLIFHVHANAAGKCKRSKLMTGIDDLQGAFHLKNGYIQCKLTKS